MAYKSYPEKLLNPLWQRKRLEILSRDNWACLKCRCTDQTLHVHHIKYTLGKDPWDYPNNSFETLCHKCHKKEHKPTPIMNVIGALIKPPEVIVLMNEQLTSLENKLKEEIPDDLMSEILKNIMFLQKKKKELLQR